ncbi:MAG: hypothetical protein II840_05080 [Kiritimatiellae bacterium]|nr:hypothetical protein [Kiritimatiellia bacterium]
MKSKKSLLKQEKISEEPKRPLAGCGRDGALDGWWAKYGLVERSIVSAQERRRRRAKAKRRSRAREFGDICEMTDGLAVRWRRDGFFDGEELACILFRDAGYYAYLDFMRRASGRRVSRLKAYVRRPAYYAAENARRRALAAERRKIRARRTDNDCPTKEQILDAWIARRKSHEDAMRFGSLIEDLECYIDNSLRRDEDGVIVGRNPGVKGWLRENIPALALQYTTVMRYKAAVKKLKQITELSDPTPMDVVLPPQVAAERVEVKQDYGADEIMVGTKVASGEAKSARSSGGIARVSHSGIAKMPHVGIVEMPESQDSEVHLSSNEAMAPHVAEVPSVEVVRARAIWEEVVKDVGKSATALFERLDALVDPARVEDTNMLAAWREKYANEITERTKKIWWLRRLWKIKPERVEDVAGVAS